MPVAITIVLLCLTLNPITAQDSQEFAGKAHNAMERGDFERALQLYSNAIELENDYYLFYFNRATCYLKLNQPFLALADLDTSVALDTARMSTRFQRGIVLAQLKQYQGAINEMSVVIANDTTNTKALLVRGRLHLDYNKNIEAACQDLRRAFLAGETTAKKYFPEGCRNE